MHPEERLAALVVEARWHTVASVLILPLLLAGMATLAVLIFGALEMGLVTAQRWPIQMPERAGVLRLQRSPLHRPAPAQTPR